MLLCVFIASGDPQSLGLADGLVNGAEVVEVDVPDTVCMPGFAAAIGADQDPWAWPVGLQCLLHAPWVQLEQHLSAGRARLGRATKLYPGTPATQPASDGLCQFANR
ncbi:hypothetical protein D3C81_1619150 [compost metagenome]